jgi:hypothetical protein
MAMASALAVVLIGGVVAPAAAQTRTAAVRQANTAIDACVSSGGEPDANVNSNGSIDFSCDYGTGQEPLFCTWSPANGYKMVCALVASGGTHAPIGGGVLTVTRVAQDLDGHGHHTHHKGQGGRR